MTYGDARSAGDPRSRLADPVFRGTLAAIAALVLLLIAFFFIFLLEKARPALAHQGVFSFIFSDVSDRAWGRIAIRMISQRVAPSASAASLSSRGTVVMSSREIALTIGTIMIARISPATK